MENLVTTLELQEQEELLALDRLVESLPRENKVFTTRAICFLMVGYCLSRRWSLSQSLRELLFKGREKLLGDCRRTRRNEHCLNTSGLSQARKNFPLEIFQELIFKLFEQIRGASPLWLGRRVVTIDGTSVTLEPAKKLREKFPPITNQYGESAFPVVLISLAHDLMTGAAFEPEMGAMYGEQKDNELLQAERIYERLEAGTVVVSDSAHGIRRMVVAAIKNSLDVVFRITDFRAKHLLGTKLTGRMDCRVIWSPSKEELKKYPSWKSDDELSGRLITQTIKHNGKVNILCVFTTLQDVAREEILSLYGRRWEMEGEIRDLKKTVGLSEIKAKTPEIVEKELLAAVVAYNLTRAIIQASAQKHGVEDPKRLSFKNTFVMIPDYAWRMLLANSEEEREHLLNHMMSWSASYINHLRARKSFQRHKYRKRDKYKIRKSTDNNDL